MAMTPLYDAIGKTVADTEKVLKEIKGKPAVICVVQTDGQENCSQEYSLSKIRSLIAEKEKDGWTFVYLGANLDAAKEAAFIGVNVANTVAYANTDAGTQQTFDSVAASTLKYAGVYGSTGATGAAGVKARAATKKASRDFFSTGGKGLDKRS